MNCQFVFTRSGDKLFIDDVVEEEKKKRWFEIQHLMENNTWHKNQIYQNKIVSVLVTGYKDGYCQGNSREMKLTKFPSDSNLLGQIVDVRIERPERWILFGKMV